MLSQGRTLEELMDNLRDAMHQLFIANKQQVEDEHVGQNRYPGEAEGGLKRNGRRP
ncbi:MAG: hypothetical protein IPI95_00030 [Flavobacteriales bacterium]|nr:hypothetical protein [Flavobacteriales bacterium]